MILNCSERAISDGNAQRSKKEDNLKNNTWFGMFLE